MMPRNRKRPIGYLLAGLFSLALMTLPAIAQDSLVPMSVQYRLLIKILDFDRLFQPGPRNEVVLGIIYQRKYRPSLEIQEELAQLIKKSGDKTETGLRLRAVPIDLLEDTDLRRQITANNIRVIYVAPLRSVDLGGIVSVSRELKIKSFTGMHEYAAHGIGITLALKGDKPLIIVNLPATKAEGSNYSSQLLGLAQVIE